ncbi:MAG: IS1634 family transposase [Candidatus Thermoplasmatota archaeon]|nr:IS1634 family transposase [Candidatus Thermoplasmatota archaeon]
MPIVNRIIARLELDERIQSCLDAVERSARGRKPDIPHGRVLTVMLRNLVVSRLPLYRLQEWVRGYVPEQLGLNAEDIPHFNDDRVATALDWFYRGDRASLLTGVVTHMVRTFDIDLSQIHQDTTSLTFFGEYLSAGAEGSSPFVMARNQNNKDHRPDLKQLVFSLCVTRDGALPVQHQVFNGNTADDNVHIEIWNMLRKIVGHTRFIYVADCKLCCEKNLRHIIGNGGRFVTVMPKNRREYTRFQEWIQTHEPDWVELIRRPNLRGKKGPDGKVEEEVFRGFTDPMPSDEGCRIIWIHSSTKARLDKESRQARIHRVGKALDRLSGRIGKGDLGTKEKIQARVDQLLAQTAAGRWIETEVQVHQKPVFHQTKPGRPGRNTDYRREMKPEFALAWKVRADLIQQDSRIDGIFPLQDNVNELDMKEVLEIYKFQPYLEKRNEQLKSVLEIAPVWLKTPTRIASYLSLVFLALLVSCLIEREMRRAMAQQKISSIPIYPEERECKTPTAEKIMQLFDGIRRSRLFEDDEFVDCFWDELNAVQRKVLRLLSVPAKEYGPC